MALSKGASIWLVVRASSSISSTSSFQQRRKLPPPRVHGLIPGIHHNRNAAQSQMIAGLLSPVVHTIPLQLLAYHAAVSRGTDESPVYCNRG